jgi:hypothetical protein
MESNFLEGIERKEMTKDLLFSRIEADFGLLPEVLKGIFSPKAVVRYSCSSVLMRLSAEYPDRIYPCFDTFAQLLKSEHRILVWNASAVIANLCIVDAEKKFEDIFDEYYALLNNEYLVTVANIVSQSGKIAVSKPHLITKITSNLLKIEELSTTPHLTEECKLVIAEKALASFNQFFNKMSSEDQRRVLSFAKRQTECSRKTLKAKAEVFLKQNKQ